MMRVPAMVVRTVGMTSWSSASKTLLSQLVRTMLSKVNEAKLVASSYVERRARDGLEVKNSHYPPVEVLTGTEGNQSIGVGQGGKDTNPRKDTHVSKPFHN